MNRYFKVKSWESFQHYKDRNPPWIKLHNQLLDNYEFECLPDASKAHLLCIWMLASRTNNKMPVDNRWISKKIGSSEDVNFDLLISSGFIELIQCDTDASKALHTNEQDATASVPSEEERQRRGEENKASNKDKSLSCPIGEILRLWKETLPGKTQPRSFDGARAQTLKARWSDAMKLTRDDGEQYYVDSESGLIWWGKLFGYIANHDFLNSDKSNWLTLQWLTKKENFLKIVERTYDN